MKRFIMDIPEELHQRLKATCALEGKTMKQVAQKLLEEYVKKEAEKSLGKGTGTEPKPTVKKQRIIEPAKEKVTWLPVAAS